MKENKPISKNEKGTLSMPVDDQNLEKDLRKYKKMLDKYLKIGDSQSIEIYTNSFNTIAETICVKQGFDQIYIDLYIYFTDKYPLIREEIIPLLRGSSNLGSSPDEAYELVRTALNIDWY